jgi:hypothetical protein
MTGQELDALVRLYLFTLRFFGRVSPSIVGRRGFTGIVPLTQAAVGKWIMAARKNEDSRVNCWPR